jgi:glycosyltransferase involved in cell wall biosynthesis
MRPSLSVIVASFNGASRIGCCLAAVEAQTIRSAIELIVVDDGSVDSTAEVAQAAGAIRLGTADIVAFLDDDCEPEPNWAERLLAAYADTVLAIGGALVPAATSGPVLGYIARRDPLAPQEIELARSANRLYRFSLYIRQQWSIDPTRGRRQVLSVPAANMSVRRHSVVAVDGFDERIRFGSEDEDLCRRLLAAFPTERLIYDPEVRVTHHFTPSLRGMMRRSRAYGRGSAIMFYKWTDFGPTFFPFPLLLVAAIGLSVRYPIVVPAALALPLVLYPRGIRFALTNRRTACVLDAYLQALEETWDDVGFLEGLWLFRRFRPAHRRRQTSPREVPEVTVGKAASGQPLTPD